MKTSEHLRNMAAWFYDHEFDPVGIRFNLGIQLSCGCFISASVATGEQLKINDLLAAEARISELVGVSNLNDVDDLCAAGWTTGEDVTRDAKAVCLMAADIAEYEETHGH